MDTHALCVADGLELVANPSALLLDLLYKLITAKNDTDELHEYQLSAMIDVYEDTKKKSLERFDRFPTISELLDGVFSFNYEIILEIARLDYSGQLGEYGYKSQCELFELTEPEYIESLFDAWREELWFDIGMNLQEHIANLMSRTKHFFYDDINFFSNIEISYDITFCINDCQNVLLNEISMEHLKNVYCIANRSNPEYQKKVIIINEILKQEA